MTNIDLQDTIAALLDLAKKEGLPKLLRTSLIKYIYLLDVYTAEENNGQENWTKQEWKFYNYGPYAHTIACAIDTMAASKIIEEVSQEQDSTLKEYKLYFLSEYRPVKDILSLGVSRSVRLKLCTDIKHFGNNLVQLLDFVYFKTSPMLNAKPGSTLLFENFKKYTVADFKPLKLQPLDPKKLKECKSKLKNLIEIKKSHQQQNLFQLYLALYSRA